MTGSADGDGAHVSDEAQVYAGNADQDGDSHRGWLLGHFMGDDDAGVRRSTDVEVKWGVHPAGHTRAGWTTGETRTTLVLLVDGRFRLDLATGGSHVLAVRGDYVVWGPGIEHSWQAEERSTVLTIRWPSVPDGLDVPDPDGA
jgi:hypothetical protein